MQQLRVKIGKSWSLVQRDGFWRALGRIWEYTVASVSSIVNVGEGQVLIITGGIGDSALYRGKHVVEELNAHGFTAQTTVQDNPFLLSYLDRFDVFVLHRVNCSARMKAFLARAQQKGKTVLFETDDLTFDADLMRTTTAYKNMNALMREQYTDGQSKCVIEDSVVEYATTTTQSLAKHVEAAGKEVFVVPNTLSQNDLDDAETARACDKLFPDGITIGYFSGSATHDRDFAQAAGALRKILTNYPETHLMIVGALELGTDFEPYAARIHRYPYVPRREHFGNIARVDISIAPLEIGDAFCESKSAIKYLEAGVVGVPTVASATAEFASVITHGENGLLAHDESEWFDALEALVTDEDKRRALSAHALTDVYAHHTTHAPGNEAYYAFLRSRIAGSTQEYLTPLQESEEDTDTVVVIANWNGKVYLETCLKALAQQSDIHFTTLVVDNGSTDGSLELVKEQFADVSWIALPENTGFAHPNNVGIQEALSHRNIQHVITLNNDTDLDPSYIAVMRAHALQTPASVGALQPKVLNFFDKTKLDATGVITAFDMSALNRGRGETDEGQYDDDTVIFGPSASAALYKRSALDTVRLPHDGYFDRRYFAYYEDVDLAWRLHLAGFSAQYIPDARVYHVHSATGKNYSPFKAFHIHRNHYFNIIKNAPFLFMIAIAAFMPIRYALLLVSVIRKKGPSAELKKVSQESTTSESMVSLVLRAWKEVVLSLCHLCRTRHYLHKKRKNSHKLFYKVLKTHHTSITKVLF